MPQQASSSGGGRVRTTKKTASRKRQRGNKPQCELGSKCPYIHQYQHSLEFSHDDDSKDDGNRNVNVASSFQAFSGSGYSMQQSAASSTNTGVGANPNNRSRSVVPSNARTSRVARYTGRDALGANDTGHCPVAPRNFMSSSALRSATATAAMLRASISTTNSSTSNAASTNQNASSTMDTSSVTIRASSSVDNFEISHRRRRRRPLGQNSTSGAHNEIIVLSDDDHGYDSDKTMNQKKRSDTVLQGGKCGTDAVIDLCDDSDG